MLSAIQASEEYSDLSITNYEDFIKTQDAIMFYIIILG
jgi:hypothetical protein